MRQHTEPHCAQRRKRGRTMCGIGGPRVVVVCGKGSSESHWSCFLPTSTLRVSMLKACKYPLKRCVLPVVAIRFYGQQISWESGNIHVFAACDGRLSQDALNAQ